MACDSHRFCVAPMMGCTDRHARYFMRQISRRARLYTEMVTTRAILYGDRQRLLAFDPQEHPLALQLGGADPVEMAECARIAEAWGYDEVNINVGCPSDRVRSGHFGACLMREPAIVASCISAMRSAVSISVTVKCRIGVDDQKPEETLPDFVEQIADAGCETVIIHARKAWLAGLSPMQNRTVPLLDYPLVHAIKAARPDLQVVINGGLESLSDARPHLAVLDGVMLGRAVYRRPWLLADIDRSLFGLAAPRAERRGVAEQMADYAGRCLARGTPLKSVTRHLMGLYHGMPGARAWRRILSEDARKPGATADLIRQAAVTGGGALPTPA